MRSEFCLSFQICGLWSPQSQSSQLIRRKLDILTIFETMFLGPTTAVPLGAHKIGCLQKEFPIENLDKIAATRFPVECDDIAGSEQAASSQKNFSWKFEVQMDHLKGADSKPSERSWTTKMLNLMRWIMTTVWERFKRQERGSPLALERESNFWKIN